MKRKRHLTLMIINFVVLFVAFLWTAYQAHYVTKNNLPYMDRIWSITIPVFICLSCLYMHILLEKKRRRVDKLDYDEKSKILTILFDNREVERYKGSVTVWHSYPDLKRCSTAKEEWLCEVYSLAKDLKSKQKGDGDG